MKYLAALLFMALMPSQVFAAQDFDTWLLNVKAEARSKGISEQTVDNAVRGIKPIPRVIELDRRQPEGRLTFAQYKDRVISDARIQQGRRLYRQHRDILERIEAKYGVQAQYIVALWGVETSYGNNTGGFNIVPALATLAHDGRRSDFFRSELMNALKILDEGHVRLADFKGSWAGAMGQNQFMPSSFHAYAVDENGDGRRDIWGTLEDIFASSANYLQKSGWDEGERWGREVRIPASLQNQISKDNKKSLIGWSNAGVTLPNGAPIPVADDISAYLVQPDGPSGPTFLAYDNFETILRWNRSNYFALSVGLIADAIAR